MRVIYSTASHLGGTGLSNVAFHAGRALYRNNSLDRLITYKNRQKEIPPHLIKRIIFQPAKVFSGLPSRYYYSMKRMWLDYRAAAYIRNHECDIFHGWSHECLHSIKAAKQWGALTIIDRGYSHPRFSEKILKEEFEVYGVARNLEKSPRWLSPFDHWRREQEEACEEFESADYVFVNSPFCYQTFLDEGFSASKLVMIPRGFDPKKYYPAPQPDKVFRAIFVGQLLIRKGLKYLLEAWEKLNLPNAELLLVGTLMDEVRNTIEPYLKRSDIRHLGFVPDPVAAYTSSSVFVFPSLDEGSAKVTYEAMACGLPVIVTPNAGSLARDGEDGFIIPIRDVDAIMEKLSYFYEHRDTAREMGQNARSRMENYTWHNYEKNLIDCYSSLNKLRSPAISGAKDIL
jgi:glycosyltransferase involved in cell wall biosynthesis